MAEVKSRATGWVGSKFVGIEEANRGQAPIAAPVGAVAPPKPVGSQGKTASEWKGSTYIGPAQPVAAPVAGPTQPLPSTPQASSGIVPGAVGNTAASGNQQWLDWSQRTYGQSASRGAGFADSGGVTLEQAIARYNAETGANARYVGGASADKADFGAGTVDALTGEGQFWSSTGGPTGGAKASGGGGGDPRLHDGIPGNARGGSGGIDKIAGPVANATSTGTQWDELYKTLLDRSNQGLGVDRNDPAVRGQADAYAANEERSKRDYLSDLAEKSGPNANLGGEQRLAAERVGQRTGGFEAELMGRELTAKRDEIQNALTQRGAMLTESQRQALQMQLAKMDDAVRRYQIKTQDSQFGRNLAQNESQYGRDRADHTADRNNYWNSVKSGLLPG